MKVKVNYWKHMRLLLIAVTVSCGVRAQYMEFEWSDEYRFTNRKTGFFEGFIGTNLINLYALQSNIAGTHPYERSKLMLVAVSKNTFAEVASVPLKGFPENKGQASVLDDLDFLKAVVTEDKIYVFWRKLSNTDSTRTEEIFAQTFNDELKADISLKKVFQAVQVVDSHQSMFDPTRCIILSNSESGGIVIGTENYTGNGVSFDYVVMTPQLNASPVKRIGLPCEVKKYPERLISEYDLAADGNVYIQNTLYYSQDELWELPMNYPKSYQALTIANAGSGKSTLVNLKGDYKTITDFGFQVQGNNTRILGFFGDLKRDTSGIDKQGIFIVDVQNEALTATPIQYVYFERTTLNRLFPKSRGRRKNSDQPSLEEQLKTRFDIERIFPMADSSLVLFFTRKYNYEEKTSRSDMNGENVYSTQQYCEKNNVSAIRITREGKILWTGNLERSITYRGTDVADLRVIDKYGKFFVLFGNELAELKPPSTRKKVQHLTQELEYATFDPNTGRAKKFTTPVNEEGVEEKDLNYLDPNSAVVFGDQVYFSKMRVRQNPLWTAANVVFVPSIYYSQLTGNTKWGKGDFTMMRIMDGKRPRKRR